MDLPPLLLVVFVVGATFRVTRLLVRDQIPLVAWPRETLVGYWYPTFTDAEWRDRYRLRRGRDPRPHWGGVGKSLAYLITCEWCTSMWVATALVLCVARWTHWLPSPTWVSAVTLGLTASGVTGLVSRWLDPED